MKHLFFIFSLCITAGFFLSLWKMGKYHESLQQITANIRRPDSAHYWRDIYKTEHATSAQILVNATAAKALFESKIDSLKGRLHLRDKQIRDILEATVSASGGGIVRIDTFRDTVEGIAVQELGHAFRYKDSLIRICGLINSDRVAVNYTIDDLPLHFTAYWKRKWFLGRKHYFIDAYSDNENVRFSRLERITIEHR